MLGKTPPFFCPVAVCGTPAARGKQIPQQPDTRAASVRGRGHLEPAGQTPGEDGSDQELLCPGNVL